MTARKWSLFLILGTTSIVAGCGGGTTANVQNPPAPATTPIAISFQPDPPSSVLVSGTASLTAVVNNDATKSGVDWALMCQNTGNCGSLSALHTNSGQATIYNPPATLPSNAQSVSIFAFATADHTKNVSTAIKVSAFAGFLKSGTYIVETSGIDIAGSAYQRVAAIVLDGNGGIKGGEQTINYTNLNTSLFSSVQDPVTGGSYYIGPDGRGTLTINTADMNIGQQGIESFSLVALSSTQALLTKTDIFNSSSPPASNESCVGTMDFQTPGAQVTTGGYAMVVRGTDLTNTPIAFGGVLNIDGPQSISGTGSKFDMASDNFVGMVNTSAVSGTVSAPDKFGTVQFNLTTSFGPQFTAYVIDNSHLKLIETDGTAGATVGLAIGQGPLTSNFSTFSGTYSFGIFGADLSTLAYTLAAAGSFTAASGSLTSGQIDELQLQSGLNSGNAPQVQISDGFTATYTVDPSGRVDTLNPVTQTPSFMFATAVNGTGPELVFYLTGAGNPILVLDADTEPLLPGGILGTQLVGGGLATGLAYPVTAGATFTGDYGLTFSQNFFTNGSPNQADSSGQICANGSSVACPGGAPDTFSGTTDFTLGFTPQGASSLTGSSQGSAVNGRLTGTLSDSIFPNNPLTVAFYVIDSSHGFFVETDGGANGANPGVLTFGYFAGRTPVCKGCP